MAINTQFGEYNSYKTEVFDEQLDVESNLNVSEEYYDKVLSISGEVLSGKTEITDNAVNYDGKVTFNFLFMGEEIERVETGVNFNLKKDLSMQPFYVTANHQISDVVIKKQGGMLVATCKLHTKLIVYYSQLNKYLYSGDFLTKIGQVDEYKYTLSSGEFNLEDEFSLARIKKVLSTSSQVSIISVQSGKNCVIVDGEGIIALTLLPFNENSDILKEERIIPFRLEVESDGVDVDMQSFANSVVDKLQVKVYVDEEKNTSNIESTLTFTLHTQTLIKNTINCVVDCYSITNQLNIDRVNVDSQILSKERSIVERFGGKCVCAVPEYARLITTVGERVEVAHTSQNGEYNVSGLVTGYCLFMVDNSIVGSPFEYPFTIKTDILEQVLESNIVIEGLNGKLRSGQLEVDGTLRLCVTEMSDYTSQLIDNVTEGEEKEAIQNSLSIYVGEAGDEEWDVIKALGESGDKIREYNSDVEFPLKGNEKLIVYRQK